MPRGCSRRRRQPKRRGARASLSPWVWLRVLLRAPCAGARPLGGAARRDTVQDGIAHAVHEVLGTLPGAEWRLVLCRDPPREGLQPAAGMQAWADCILRVGRLDAARLRLALTLCGTLPSGDPVAWDTVAAAATASALWCACPGAP
eukprot:TRINITY_DN30278_c0_g1_i2.p1 TRINITY_DN30278_c0_g1~~TRINITY_DN30278_c0_g1_i2.p1  ORF type:complete len:167 (+),score=42.21 TRINITY_DN30278_c0_g1_i2:66-503(+)